MMYLFQSRPLTEGQLTGLSLYDLRLLRNEVYARHGRTFTDPLLQSYFASRTWDHPDPRFDLRMLTPIERANILTLQRYEARVRDGQRFTPG